MHRYDFTFQPSGPEGERRRKNGKTRRDASERPRARFTSLFTHSADHSVPVSLSQRLESGRRKEWGKEERIRPVRSLPLPLLPRSTRFDELF